MLYQLTHQYQIPYESGGIQAIAVSDSIDKLKAYLSDTVDELSTEVWEEHDGVHTLGWESEDADDWATISPAKVI